MRLTAVMMIGTVALFARKPVQQPDPYIGRFELQSKQEHAILQLAGADGRYSGSIRVAGRILPVTAKAAGESAAGSVERDGQLYAFTLAPNATGLKLTGEGQDFQFERMPCSSKTPGETPKEGDGSASGAENDILGGWRGDPGDLRFDSDGTVRGADGQLGRYEIHGDQITLIEHQARVTVGFEVCRDTLTMTTRDGQEEVLKRVPEDARRDRK